MLDDGFAHVCRGEDGGGGAEGEDLLQDPAAVEIVIVELYGIGVCLLVVAGFFVVAREHHEAAFDGVVLTLDAQGHALAAVREKLMESFLYTLGDWRVKALDRRESRNAHLDGARLVGLPDDEIVAVGRCVVFEAAGRADSLVEMTAAVAVGIGELMLLAQGLPDGSSAQEDGLVRCGDEGRLIYCCDNLAPCEQCMHGRTCRKRIQEQADVYFLQNYLSHVEPTEQETFLDKMRATVEQAKPGAVFVIIDLQYAGSKAIMRELAGRVQAEWDVPAEVIGTNLFTGGAPAWSRCPYEMPAEVQSKIFRGDSGFVPKKWTRYYYLVLQKQ